MNSRKPLFTLVVPKALIINDASISWNEARLLMKDKNVAEAVYVARNTIEWFPEDVEGMGVLGSCLAANKDIEEAFLYLSKAIELNLNYAEAFINKDLIHLTKKIKLRL